MFEDIFETIIIGSNTVFLNVPEQDYFFTYKDLNMEAAQEITGNYFDMKQKNGMPHAKDIDFDSITHKVKITVDVEKNRKQKFIQHSIPEVLNAEIHE